MRAEKAASSPPQPKTRQELAGWIHAHLRLPAHLEQELVAVLDDVFTRHERLWQESKQEAIRALSAGFAEKMAKVKRELNVKDATVSSISRYFEQLVADLTDKTHRDPKTKLINFGRFTEQLESFLALEQRGRWCAVGLVDIAGFKWYNDALGHAVGDRIIERVAQLLREQVRADDLIAQDRPTTHTPFESVSPQHPADRSPATLANGVDRRTSLTPSPPESSAAERQPELHARFGGDEFCFLIPDLVEYRQAYTVAERFREAVEQYDWTTEDPRLAVQPVRVDVGVACLNLGRVSDRRFIARRLAAALIQRADQLMYEAKNERANHIYLIPMRVDRGELVDMSEDEVGSASLESETAAE